MAGAIRLSATAAADAECDQRTVLPVAPAPGPGARRRPAAPYVHALLPDDPRLLQIVALGVLLTAGAWLRDFSLRPAQVALTFAAGLGAQRLLDALAGTRTRTLRSAVISSLSVSLLLRADSLWAMPAAAAAAIASKFLIRLRGKHLFNPANFGIAAALLLAPGTWISPGQWGDDVALAGWLVALGSLVAGRARRADTSWPFLVFYLGALAARVDWLGQNWTVWTHQLQSGALLLFAFFMISDPKTTPDHALGRAAHAALVAAIAYTWGFGLFRTNAVIWALFAAAPMVPVWDAIWPGPKFEWTYGGAIDGTQQSDESRPERSGGVPVGAVHGG
jgi:Na+-transporting NADH:ubiquinone oxidoreductase subunit NqrB